MTARPILLRPLAAALIAIFLLAAPVTVVAHAELQEVSPADAGSVTGTPAELTATFDEALEDGSTLSIRDSAGNRLAVGAIDPSDAMRLVIADVPELAPGTYEMRWTASSDDGHIERGTWTFTVTAAASAEPSASASPSAAATTTTGETLPPTPEATPVVTTTPSGPIEAPADPAASSGEIFLPIIATAAIVLIGGALLLSRRNRPSDPR